MKRPARIALEVLAPPLLTLIMCFALNAADLISGIAYGQVHFNEEMLLLVWVCLAVGVIGGIYAIAMEIAFSRFLLPESWSAVALSTTFGAVVGSLIGAGVYHLAGSHADARIVSLPAAAGTSFGFIVGVTVRLLSKKSQNQALQDNALDHT